MKKWLCLYFCLVLVIVLSGCAYTAQIRKIDPIPRINIDRDSSNQTLKLVLDLSINDSFVIPPKVNTLNRIDATIEVSSWRESLQAGFTKGFSNLFKITEKEGPDLTLQVMKAEIGFEDHLNDARTYGHDAVVTYRAQLLDKSGKKIKGTAKTSKSKTPFSFKGQEAEAVKTAVEAMYEQMAQDLFQN